MNTLNLANVRRGILIDLEEVSYGDSAPNEDGAFGLEEGLYFFAAWLDSEIGNAEFDAQNMGTPLTAEESAAADLEYAGIDDLYELLGSADWLAQAEADLRSKGFTTVTLPATGWIYSIATPATYDAAKTAAGA